MARVSWAYQKQAAAAPAADKTRRAALRPLPVKSQPLAGRLRSLCSPGNAPCRRVLADCDRKFTEVPSGGQQRDNLGFC